MKSVKMQFWRKIKVEMWVEVVEYIDKLRCDQLKSKTRKLEMWEIKVVEVSVN